MNYIKLIYSIAWIAITHYIHADPLITIFFRDYPAAQTEDDAAYSSHHIFGSPKKFARTQLEGTVCRNLKAGIWGSYAGFLELSNADGQLTFPRKHGEPMVLLIITQRITPIIMFEQTVHHWELMPSVPHAIYRYERLQDDETGRYYWNVTQVPSLPNPTIPSDAVILLAKPEHLYIPTGITLTHESPSLILPSIYVKRGFNLASNTLYLLNINHLFNHARMKEKEEATRLTTQTVG